MQFMSIAYTKKSPKRAGKTQRRTDKEDASKINKAIRTMKERRIARKSAGGKEEKDVHVHVRAHSKSAVYLNSGNSALNI